MAILFWIVFALATGGVLYGVLTHKKRFEHEDELGLKEVRRFDRSWVPLTIVVDPELNKHMDTISDAACEAAEFWNVRTGLRLFFPPGEVVREGGVIPLLSAPIDGSDHEDVIAYTRLQLTKNGAIRSAAIYVVPGWILTKAILKRALAHEFGHCLGLAHDGVRGSVMHGTALEGAYLVTEKDAEFLRQTYG